MEILIDIPEEVYNSIKSNEEIINYITKDGGGSMALHGSLAIINGTILPKGHGDLIERSEAIKINELHHGQMPNLINHQIWNEINDAPTIIKADKKVRIIDENIRRYL